MNFLPNSSPIENLPLISIIIPCYNSGKTISRAVISAKNQTYSNIEVIVVDDGSTDTSTISILDSLSDITLVRQENLGLPSARNTGIMASHGLYILPLDSDDWLHSDSVQLMLQSLQSCPNICFSVPTIILHGQLHGSLMKHYNFFEQLFLNQIPYCLLIPRCIFDHIGYYDSNMTNGYEDWEFNIRMGLNGYLGIDTHLPLLNYNVSGSGMLISKSNRMHGHLWSFIQRKYPNTYSFRSLFSIWMQWRDLPSTYPLPIYFIWFYLHRILPTSVFSFLFSHLRRFSQSRR